MDCNEYRERVTPAVDGALPEREMRQFESHIGACGGCRKEYQLESATKRFVHDRVAHVTTPGTLRLRISRQIKESGTTWAESMILRFREWSEMPFFRPALALGVTAIALLVLFNGPSERRPGQSLAGADVILQSVANYARILDGEIKPEVVSDRADDIVRFFEGKTDFAVQVPAMRDCRLVGAVFNRHEGRPLAHVVYMHDGQMIYMYEASWPAVRDGGVLKLDAAACAELEKTGWHTRPVDAGRTVVLWTRGETLCAAVSTLPGEELMACLQSGGEGYTKRQ